MSEVLPMVFRRLRASSRFKPANSQVKRPTPSPNPEILHSRVVDVPDPIRFGQLVAQRRGELGLTQADVHARGGPSDLTLRKLERGETAKPDNVTLTKLERALEWTRGSASRAFQGGNPESLGTQELATEVTMWTSLRPPYKIVGIDQGVVIRTDGLADLTRSGRTLDDLPPLGATIDGQVAELRQLLDRLTRAWLIRQAEIARARDTLSALVITLDDHLRQAPVESIPADDLTDLKYLRWLAGYYADPDPAELEEFERRFQLSAQNLD